MRWPLYWGKNVQKKQHWALTKVASIQRWPSYWVTTKWGFTVLHFQPNVSSQLCTSWECIQLKMHNRWHSYANKLQYIHWMWEINGLSVRDDQVINSQHHFQNQVSYAWHTLLAVSRCFVTQFVNDRVAYFILIIQFDQGFSKPQCIWALKVRVLGLNASVYPWLFWQYKLCCGLWVIPMGSEKLIFWTPLRIRVKYGMKA